MNKLDKDFKEEISTYLKKKNEFKLKTGLKYLFEWFSRQKEKESFRSQNFLKNRAFLEIQKEVDIVNL